MNFGVNCQAIFESWVPSKCHEWEVSNIICCSWKCEKWLTDMLKS